MALLRGGTVPSHRLLQVLRSARAEFHAPAQLRLRWRIPQPGGGAVPLHCLSVILLHTRAPAVCLAQQELGPGKALRRALLETLRGFGVILFHTNAVGIAVAQIRQSRYVIPGRGLGVQQHRLPGIRRNAHPRLKAPGQIRQAQGVIHGDGPLVAGQGVGPARIIHGIIAQGHPVGRGQFLLRHGVEERSAAAGAKIRLRFGHKAAVRIFTTVILHIFSCQASSSPSGSGSS